MLVEVQDEKIHELEALLEEEKDEDKRLELEEEIRKLRIRARAVSFIDPETYATTTLPSQTKVHKPVFFVMDVVLQ